MRTKHFLAKLDHDRIVRAIATAEAKTSGEIRVFIERGRVGDVVAAARKKFGKLGMSATKERNAVLIFVAPRSQKFAVLGDDGIHQRCGDEFWQQLVNSLREDFAGENFTQALSKAIGQVGDLLTQFFPCAPNERTNQLPDDVED